MNMQFHSFAVRLCEAALTSLDCFHDIHLLCRNSKEGLALVHTTIKTFECVKLEGSDLYETISRNYQKRTSWPKLYEPEILESFSSVLGESLNPK